MFPSRQAKLSSGQKCRRRSNGEIVVTRFAHVEGNWIVAWLCHDKDGYPVIVPTGDLEPLVSLAHEEPNPDSVLSPLRRS